MTKAEFVKKLEELVCFADIFIESLTLRDDETIVIRYKTGWEKTVNISCNSKAAIIRDVANQLY